MIWKKCERCGKMDRIPEEKTLCFDCAVIAIVGKESARKIKESVAKREITRGEPVLLRWRGTQAMREVKD